MEEDASHQIREVACNDMSRYHEDALPKYQLAEISKTVLHMIVNRSSCISGYRLYVRAP